jgi:hypothetical protein
MMWKHLFQKILKSIFWGFLALGFFKIIHYFNPPSERSEVAFTYICVFFTTFFTVLVFALRFGWTHAKDAELNEFMAFIYGAIWGAILQIVITVTCMLETSVNYFWKEKWINMCLNNLWIMPLIIGTFAFGGFALKSQKWQLILLFLGLVRITYHIFLRHYSPLF